MTAFKNTMTPFILTLFLLVSCLTKTNTAKSDDPLREADSHQQKDTSLNGLYTGLEEMCRTDSTGKKDCYEDPASPERKWYHLGFLKIRGDSVFLDQNPISLYKADTSYSASDGAFYYYSGTLQKNDTTVLFHLKELFCDYCGVPVKIKPDGTREVIKRTKQLEGRITDEGLIINGFLYSKRDEKVLISEHPEPYLDSQ